MWEDPLKSNSYKRKNSIREEFSRELHPFMQNIILADFLSNLALSIIGAKEKITCNYSEYVHYYDELEEICRKAEKPYLDFVNLKFQKRTTGNFVFKSYHELFKAAYITSAFDIVINGHENEGQELKFLLDGAMGIKLFGECSTPGDKTELEKYYTIQERLRDFQETYHKGDSASLKKLINAYWGGLSETVIASDITDAFIVKASLILEPLLLEYVRLLEAAYRQIIYG